MTTVYHYAKCSTCRNALRWLNTHNIQHDARSIVDETPSVETLLHAIEKSGLPFRRFFNTSGQSYRNGGFKERIQHMSVQDAAEALAADGMLIKRPLLIREDTVLVGFKEDEWAAVFVP